LVAVYDGTNAYFYVNGQSVGTGLSGWICSEQKRAVDHWRREATRIVLFAGSADELAIYTNILSAADVLVHYQNGTNASRGTPYNVLVGASNPLLYYRLDEPVYTVPDPSNSLPCRNQPRNAFWHERQWASTSPAQRREWPDRPLAGWDQPRWPASSMALPETVQLGDFGTLLSGTMQPTP
jgi:hypothetical protein